MNATATTDSDTATSRELVHPATGQVLNLATATTTDLAGAFERLEELLGDLRNFRQGVIDEVAHRLDKVNSRTETVGDYTMETNPPTEDAYTVKELREALEALVESGDLEGLVVDRVIVYPRPSVPPPRVDKREVNKLKRSDNRRVLAALAKVRRVQPQTRTLKVKRAAEAKGGE